MYDTKKEVYTKLKNSGFVKGTTEWADYERAKKIIIGDAFMTPTRRESIARWISDYLGV